MASGSRQNFGSTSTADAALALHARGVRAEDVESVAVCIEPGGSQAIIHHRPRTGLEGKLRGEYVVAACLVYGRGGISSGGTGVAATCHD
jgi:MmgE/PrpD C-terminal domain